MAARNRRFWLADQAGDNATADSHQPWDGTLLQRRDCVMVLAVRVGFLEKPVELAVQRLQDFPVCRRAGRVGIAEVVPVDDGGNVVKGGVQCRL